MECTNNAVVYSKPNCPQCVQAKALLTKNSVCFEEHIVGEDITIEDLFLAVGHPVRSVPQIFLNGIHLSTVSELQTAIALL